MCASGLSAPTTLRVALSAPTPPCALRLAPRVSLRPDLRVSLCPNPHRQRRAPHSRDAAVSPRPTRRWRFFSSPTAPRAPPPTSETGAAATSSSVGKRRAPAILRPIRTRVVTPVIDRKRDATFARGSDDRDPSRRGATKVRALLFQDGPRGGRHTRCVRRSFARRCVRERPEHVRRTLPSRRCGSSLARARRACDGAISCRCGASLARSETRTGC